MANEVIELPSRQDNNMPVTGEDVLKLHRQRDLLRQYVAAELKRDVDYGTIPGTPKDTLFKSGAEKLARLFGLGVRLTMSDKELDRAGNFAMFTYKAQVYLLNNPGVVIAECEGSCNSQEKKYRERRAKGGIEETPVCDILNTLQKMAQKRAMVGAVILSVAGSDFFTQDIDDPEDAATMKGNQPARVQASVPKATRTASQNQAAPTPAAAESAGVPSCELCQTVMRLSRSGDAYTCPNWQDQSKGRHSYVPVK